MLAGQYVVHDQQLHQVVAITGPTPGHGAPVPATVELVDRHGRRRWVTNGTVKLAPGCEPCGRPAGFAGCALTGEHDGPLPARPARQPAAPPRRDPWANRGGAPCSCWRAGCGECERRMHAGERMPA